MTPKASLVAAITAAAVVWDGAAARPAAARCQPAVSVKGDDDDVARIARALNQYQVASQSTSGCAAWQVTASRASGQLALQIDDGHGLTLVRRVTSPAAAAAVIDSWVHHNLAIASADGARSDSRAPPQHAEVARPRHPRTFVTSAHALETVQKGGKAATPTEPSRAAEAAPTESRDDKEPATAPKVERTQAADTDLPVINRVVPRLADAAGRRGPVSVGLGAEASFGNDGSVWWGGHLSGCMTVGSFCVGLLARGDTTALNAVGEPGSVKRRGADGLAFIGVPIALGRMTLLPEVGLGAGVRRSTVSLQNT
ncbi:MAG: hypothetical protein QOI66_3932, partial [Myxococcales bacterium]|nr:hypothetical protein [Myxococcales bacterium]